MDMDMDLDVEEDNSSGEVEYTFTAVEIDIDYEFEAARFFDFTRTETSDEAREAEMWFESIGSYPPSPFAVRLLSRGKSENDNGVTVSKGFDNSSQLDGASDRAPEDFSMATCSNTDGDVTNQGIPLDLKGYCLQASQKQHTTRFVPKDGTRDANCKSKTKSSWKPSFPRTSTLMKPTASQLAKQNQERLIHHFRFQKPANNSSAVESQATKRQKLEGGHLFKVTETKQQTNFVHKAPKREGILDGNLGHGRLGITVPRPPELATAQRAQRRQKGDDENEHVASRVPRFRARPLNRKIFEAPSFLHQKRSTPQLPEFHEFHLKTTERAEQNTAAVLSTSACCNNLKAPQKSSLAFGAESSSRESKGSHVPGVRKQEDCETMHRFKALPLNKKIFSSKGDLGVFKSSKRETTVAMAFNFQTEKRAQYAPPVDLFNKLSLASESVSRSSRPPSIFTKGSKENRVCSFQQQSAVNIPKLGSKQVHFTNTITDSGPPLSTISRNSGVR